MNTYIALLRGVNVSGHNKVAMNDLRAIFVALGHSDVQTYIQSGNVVFKSASAKPADLTQAIEQACAKKLGVDVTVVLRTRAELTRTASSNPFLERGVDPARLHVTFLAEFPHATALEAMPAKQFLPDEFQVIGRDVYLHCPNGYGRTKLNNTFFESRLGVRATTRNWNTVGKLLEMASH